LEHGDVFLPPDADTTGSLEVIPIHDDVNSQVQRDRHPRNRGVANELRVAEESGRAMVIGVEESERLLFEDEKDSIDEFEVFGQVIHIVEHNQSIGPTSIVATNGMENAVSRQFGEKLFDEEGQETTADEGQIEIVNHERAVEDEGLAVFHQFPSAKDYDIVGGQCNNRLFESRHGRLALYKLEVIGRVAKDGLVAFGEDRP
jgi:hypothetical protein